MDELIENTKRIRAVLTDDKTPTRLPPGYLYQQVRGREWVITVGEFSADKVEFIRNNNGVTHIDVEDMSLDEVFKDIIRGQKEAA